MPAFVEWATAFGFGVGRRAAALPFFGLFERIIGVELLAAPSPTVAHNELFRPMEGWGPIWPVASSVGVAATFWRQLDALAFAVVIAMLTLFGFATHAAVVSGWPEPGKATQPGEGTVEQS